jgi:3-oxoacyl-[acyl-carrier protein] reductase
MSKARFFKRIRQALRCAVQGYRYGGNSIARISYPVYGDILAGKKILVTGGSSGIGLAIAKKYVECGADVLITGRNSEKLAAAVNEIGKEHCFSMSWDISRTDEIEKRLDECESLLGGEISALVNNAGIAPSRFWGNVDEEEWDKIYSTNLKGLFFLTQSLAKRWKGQIKSDEYRKIVNISSQGGFVGATYPYRMVKWDIRGLTEGLGKALVKDRIIVNGIAPGVVKTSMQQFSLQQGENLYTDQNPVERVILPEEVAELALFLMSDASNAIVGQTVVCDGGYTLK